MVAFNLTGEVDEMRRRHDLVLEEGGTCVMASLTAVGMSGMIALGRHTQLPIHAHRCGWGALTRAPLLGWSYPAWSKLWRLAGADHMHVNGIDNKFTATLAAAGSPDFLVTAGGGVVAHPEGVAAGVAALRQAYDAALSGIDVLDYAKDHPALAAALKAY